ncbi:concanavalin A-like lectin/glucanase domain-containing protein [Gigaspora rosea]|uniref:Concanavalin A-like lectin/glucanase domain-containing protein n=1 Tax=Gigaspora rosea TaxID=44941 RepID=A0A397VY65_9GLOM|nr:concanavalin A-like lectin/glucanase domain-containing protein [Gigaspora rosea]
MSSDEFLPSYLRHSPINKYKKNAYKSILLPTHWNSVDCWPYISVMDEDNLKLKYNGPGRVLSDEASIRTNKPIPPEVGLFYFEITILSSEKNGCIGVGYCKSDVDLNILPGWISDSIGYHGDDGRLFCGRGNGKMFGPCYAAGDTIGCGINFFNMEIFFTKNGINIVGEMYPMCGMAINGECIVTNFGTKPFMFDIDNYAEAIFAKAEPKERT